MTKRELAQRMLVAVVQTHASIPREAFPAVAASLCALVDALHDEMDRRAGEEHTADGRALPHGATWMPC